MGKGANIVEKVFTESAAKWNTRNCQVDGYSSRCLWCSWKPETGSSLRITLTNQSRASTLRIAQTRRTFYRSPCHLSTKRHHLCT